MENVLYIKTLFLSLVLFLFVGCSTTSTTVPLPKPYYKQNNSLQTKPKNRLSSTGFYKPTILQTKQKNTNKTLVAPVAKTVHEINYSGSGYIKGIIEKAYFSTNKKSWIYYIKGLDFTNHKLKYAKVYATKKLAEVNDFVYAIIQDGAITSLYIYKSAKSYRIKKKRKIVKKSKQKRKIVKKVRKTPKTRKREQILSAPEVEEVTF